MPRTVSSKRKVALGDEGRLAADLALAQPAQVDAVEQHVPVGGVDQPDQQAGQGGLARAGRADDGDACGRPARRR